MVDGPLLFRTFIITLLIKDFWNHVCVTIYLLFLFAVYADRYFTEKIQDILCTRDPIQRTLYFIRIYLTYFFSLPYECHVAKQRRYTYSRLIIFINENTRSVDARIQQ